MVHRPSLLNISALGSAVALHVVLEKQRLDELLLLREAGLGVADKVRLQFLYWIEKVVLENERGASELALVAHDSGANSRLVDVISLNSC